MVLSEPTGGEGYRWTPLRHGLDEMLRYVAGRQQRGETEWASIPERLHDEEGITWGSRAEVVWFDDREGLACFTCSEGPPYSDVTPDPRWPAYTYYWQVER